MEETGRSRPKTRGFLRVCASQSRRFLSAMFPPRKQTLDLIGRRDWDQTSDYPMNAEIFGIDVAPDTQFEGEQRIHTHRFDSRHTEKVKAFFALIGQPLPDLIVDDGLHEAAAQIATLRNFLPFLRPGGLYVVEDVKMESIPTILHELYRYHDCPFFVDHRTEPWVAVVIRKPIDQAQDTAQEAVNQE
jgi:hypothetical protein